MRMEGGYTQLWCLVCGRSRVRRTLSILSHLRRNSDSSVGTVTRLRTGRPMDGGSIRGRGSLLLCKRSRQSQSAGD